MGQFCCLLLPLFKRTSWFAFNQFDVIFCRFTLNFSFDFHSIFNFVFKKIITQLDKTWKSLSMSAFIFFADRSKTKFVFNFVQVFSAYGLLIWILCQCCKPQVNTHYNKKRVLNGFECECIATKSQLLPHPIFSISLCSTTCVIRTRCKVNKSFRKTNVDTAFIFDKEENVQRRCTFEMDSGHALPCQWSSLVYLAFLIFFFCFVFTRFVSCYCCQFQVVKRCACN